MLPFQSSIIRLMSHNWPRCNSLQDVSWHGLVPISCDGNYVADRNEVDDRNEVSDRDVLDGDDGVGRSWYDDHHYH